MEARTGFFVCSLDVKNWLTLFRIEKISKGWSFWSVTKTSLLSYSCFFFPLVLLVALLVRGKGEEEKENDDEGKVGGVRPFFSFSA